MSREEPTLDWSTELIDSLWFHIGHYLTIDDLQRLSQTCSRLQQLFTGNDFWSHLIRIRFGPAVWRRFIQNSSLLADSTSPVCRSKLLYLELLQRKCVSFADIDRISLDTNRNYTTLPDASSLSGQVLQIHDSVEFCYALQIETLFKNILPGRYDVIYRMKLDLPYMLGETEFLAVAEQDQPAEMALTRWTQEDFLSMYRCFHCDHSKSNLWFYQNMGTVEIHGDQPCDVYVSLLNQDSIHAKHGLSLDFVELKLRPE